MVENVIISNPEKFARLKETLRAGGASMLHVVADFDKTLTMGVWKGEKRFSLIELIRKYYYLPPGYVEEAYGLADTYRPWENDLSLTLEERKKRMVEWWSTHVKVMSKYGLSREIVEKIIHEQEMGPRDGLSTFLDTLSSKRVPFLIFSAAVTDLIEGFLRKEKMLHENTHIISNAFAFDANGRVLGYQGTVIHSLNKSEVAVKDTPYYSQIVSRPNVILLGDGLGDVEMVDGLEHECVLKIGFLNDNVEKNLDAYKQAFDVVILNDGPLDFVNDLLNEIL
jgi:5'-nucleotidase